MIHYGDITKIKGAEVPLVDIVTGGSPCQDLSIAGKRQGLAGERSGLFMEQIRVIKELRDESRKRVGTDDPRRIVPRFMVWENVPGAFSSNKGEDFRAVLEETAKVAERDACIPGSPNGKWPHSGCIMGDGWSIAWRVHDAQFWGVPQRRKRIALVADFAGGAAPEILFERKGLSGDSAESGEERKGTTADAERSIGETSRAISFQERAGKPGGGKGILIQNERTGALSTVNNQSVCAFEPGAASRLGGYCYDNMCGALRANMGDNQTAVCYGISSYASNAMKSANPHSGVYEADTSRTLDLNGGNPACNQGGMMVVQSAGFDGYNQSIDIEIAQPLRAADGGDSTPKVVCLEGNGSRPSHKGDGYAESDTMYTLNSTEHHAVAYNGSNITCPTNASNPKDGDPCYTLTDDSRNYVVIENHPADSRVKVSDKDNSNAVVQSMEVFHCTTEEDKVQTLKARDYKDPQIVCTSVVRRLTPMECERLQGFPDGWTDIGDWIDSKGKKHKGESDSPRYKALGNSIALPFWQWMARKMVKYIDGHQPTMASLFSGIGGFELVFARAGCKPVWNSEIESFPEAVTRVHFGDDDTREVGDYERYL